MLKKLLLSSTAAAAIFFAGYSQGLNAAADRVFELRTYTTFDGKLENLNARFRNHTTKIFEKHGMTNIGYWVPMDEPKKSNTLIYLLAHKSREEAKKSWDAFRNDPEWKKVAAESEKDGKINQKVESIYLEPVDYSKIK
ncbi:MAG: NIPSNAP family protein [Bryobacteraceae bacterium]|nr:NIPSNAP family protein [Bryobacteraceae bacterium]